MKLYLVYESWWDVYEVLFIEKDLDSAMEKAKAQKPSQFTIGIEIWEDDGSGSFKRVKEVWNSKGA